MFLFPQIPVLLCRHCEREGLTMWWSCQGSCWAALLHADVVVAFEHRGR